MNKTSVLCSACSLAIVGLVAVACGGSDAPPRDPASMPTTPQGSAASDAWANARVSGGTATEVPSVAPPPSSAPPVASGNANASPPTTSPSGSGHAPAPPAPVTSPTTSPYPKLPAGPCDACQGTVTPELQTALNKRLEATKSCYVRVLTNNPGARASMNVEVKVGRDGTTCDAFAHVDQPAWPGLADCVVAEFRKGNFPVPGNASCVVARVPALFTPAQ